MEKNKPENTQTLFLFLVTRTNMSIYDFIYVLGSQNRKNESKMVMAKRQRRGKVPENGIKENPRTQVRTSGETNWLAQFAQGRLNQGRRQNVQKRGSQDGLRPLLLGGSTLTFLCLPKKTLSCNRAVTLAHHFKSLLW